MSCRYLIGGGGEGGGFGSKNMNCAVSYFFFCVISCDLIGADCPDGRSFIPTVKDSVWKPRGGLYVLVNCPPGYQLLNSTQGTSHGMFSPDIQQCRPCPAGQYIINPNTDECQDCPPGKNRTCLDVGTASI